jgi:hypothetical protein
MVPSLSIHTMAQRCGNRSWAGPGSHPLHSTPPSRCILRFPLAPTMAFGGDSPGRAPVAYWDPAARPPRIWEGHELPQSRDDGQCRAGRSSDSTLFAPLELPLTEMSSTQERSAGATRMSPEIAQPGPGIAPPSTNSLRTTSSFRIHPQKAGVRGRLGMARRRASDDYGRACAPSSASPVRPGQQEVRGGSGNL